MANRERGEGSAVVDGKEYTLRPWFNAVCSLEDKYGKSFEVVLSECGEGRMSGLRACVWCLLQKYHGEEIQTLEAAGDWIEKAGGVDVVYFVVKSILDANDEPASSGKPDRPRKARVVGIGGRSSSRRVKSA